MVKIYLPAPIDGACYGCARSPCGRCMCLDCDPPLLDMYTVTLSGLAGDFADCNGPHMVINRAYDAGVKECLWRKRFGGDLAGIMLSLSTAYWFGHPWEVKITSGWLCYVRFSQIPNADCVNIQGAYAFLACRDDNCADGDTCEDSSPNCVVS